MTTSQHPTGSYDVNDDEPDLLRVMGPKLLLLFIVGDILGTGVYALTGQVAGEVGGAAWAPFLVAFIVATITAMSYLELVTKYPQAAGAALYTHKAFGVHFFTFIVAFTVMCSGITSASTASNAFAGFVNEGLRLRLQGRRHGPDGDRAGASWPSWRPSTSVASARASRPTWCSPWSSSPVSS